MSELTLFLIRFAYLAILWIFVLSAISVIRTDMFGARMPSGGAAPPRSEILAVRRVWVRIVVDGVKTTERELQAGERVSLPAGGAVAIRAGNAGALQVTINGEDRGVLGAEGEVVTRTLRIPAPPVR